MGCRGKAAGRLLPLDGAFADGARALFSLGEGEMRAIFGMLEEERDAFSTMSVRRALPGAAAPPSVIRHMLVYMAHEHHRRGRGWLPGAAREIASLGAPKGAVDLFFRLSGGLGTEARAAVADMFGAMEYSARRMGGRRFGVEIRHCVTGPGAQRIIPTVTIRIGGAGRGKGHGMRMDADEFEVFVTRLSESLEAAKRGMHDAKARLGRRYVRLVGASLPTGGGRGGAGRAPAPATRRPAAGSRGSAGPRAGAGARGCMRSLAAAADACLEGAVCRASLTGPGSWIVGPAGGQEARRTGAPAKGDPEAIVGLIRSFGDNSSLVSAMEECREFTRRMPSKDVPA